MCREATLSRALTRILSAGTLGEVIRTGNSAFSAELRSLSHALNQPRGRLYQRLCDADLGDARCGVNLNASDFRSEGVVERVESEATFRASGLSAFADRHFSRGLLTWTGGGDDGLSAEVRRHAKLGSLALIELVCAPPHPLAEGDAFTIRAGCAKTFDVCRQKFGNGLNFRGFPHLPGNDFLVAPARRGEGNDGRALVKTGG